MYHSHGFPPSLPSTTQKHPQPAFFFGGTVEAKWSLSPPPKRWWLVEVFKNLLLAVNFWCFDSSTRPAGFMELQSWPNCSSVCLGSSVIFIVRKKLVNTWQTLTNLCKPVLCVFCWLMGLFNQWTYANQKQGGKKYSTIKNIKTLVNPCQSIWFKKRWDINKPVTRFPGNMETYTKNLKAFPPCPSPLPFLLWSWAKALLETWGMNDETSSSTQVFPVLLNEAF